MNRANGIGPSRSISARMRAASLGSLSGSGAAGSSSGTRRSPASTRAGSALLARHARSPRATGSPGPTRLCAAEGDRDLVRPGVERQLLQPRVAHAVRQEEVRCVAILGRRPAGLVGTEAVGQQDARVDHGAVGQPGDDRADLVRSLAVEEHAQRRGRRRAGQGRPSAARAPRRGHESGTPSGPPGSSGSPRTPARGRAAPPWDCERRPRARRGPQRRARGDGPWIRRGPRVAPGSRGAAGRSRDRAANRDPAQGGPSSRSSATQFTWPPSPSQRGSTLSERRFGTEARTDASPRAIASDE